MEIDLELEMKLSRREFRLLLLHEFRLGRKATESTSNICGTMDKAVLSIRTAQHWFHLVMGRLAIFKISNSRNYTTENAKLRKLYESMLLTRSLSLFR